MKTKQRKKRGFDKNSHPTEAPNPPKIGAIDPGIARWRHRIPDGD